MRIILMLEMKTFWTFHNEKHFKNHRPHHDDDDGDDDDDSVDQ